MKLLTFAGYSDDTFSCEGPGIDVDYDNCASGQPIYMRVDGDGGGMIVVGQYAAGPCGGWHIAVGPVWDNTGDDEPPIPDWPISIMRSERPYSPQLVVTAPDDVCVRLVGKDGAPLTEKSAP